MRRAIDKGLLDGLIGYHLRRAQARVFDDFMRALDAEGVSPGQFGVLTLIDANTGLNQSALAEAIGIERSTMVAVLAHLEKRGLIERRPSPADRRAKVLSLSIAGAQLLGKAVPKVRRHEDTVFAALTTAERKTLTVLLRKVMEPAPS